MRSSLNRKVHRSAKLGNSVRNAVEDLEQRLLFTGFTAGDLAVETIGNGSTALSGNAAQVSVEEFSPTGSSQTSAFTVPLPTTSGSGSTPNALLDNGTGTTDGMMNLSANDQYLVLPGYISTVGTASVTTTGNTGHVIGRIDSSGNVDTTTTFSAYTTAGDFRGAESVDGQEFWTSGNSAATAGPGVQYVGYGNTSSTQISSTSGTLNNRAISIFDSQLYTDGSTSVGPLFGPGTVGTGLPTSSSTLPVAETQLSGFPTASGSSSYQFVFANPTTVYIADDSTTGSTVGINKWTFNGTTWALQYTTPFSAGVGFTGIAVSPSGALYGVTGQTSNNDLVAITDTGSGFTFTTLATAGTDFVFRGVAMAPQASTPAPIIYTQPPTTASGAVGTSVSISASSYGALLPSAQWYESPTGAPGTFTAINDATNPSAATSTLTLSNLTSGQSGTVYEVQFTTPLSGGLTTISNSTTLTVTSAPQFNFDAPTYSFAENAGTAVVQVDLAGTLQANSTYTVGYSTGGGTAVAGTNYTAESSPPNAALTFSTNNMGVATPQDITVPLSAVYPQGGNLTFNITLSNPTGSGATIGSANTTTVTIVDNGEFFNFSDANYTSNVNSTAEVSIVRTGVISDSASVNYTAGGSPGTASFAANQSIATFSVSTSTSSISLAITGESANPPTTVAKPGTLTSATINMVDPTTFTNTLSGVTAANSSIETIGFASANDGFSSVSGSSTGSPSHPFIYQVLDFSKTTAPGLYPDSGVSVNSLSNLSLALDNTSTTGTFGGVVGNFNVYVIPDTTTTVGTGNTTVKFNASGGTFGTGLDDTEFNPQDAYLLGTFSFTNDVLGYDTFSTASLPQSGPSAAGLGVATIITALNNGSNIRLALAPAAIGGGGMFADWGPSTTATEAPQMTLAAVLSAQQVTVNIDTTATQTYVKGTNTFATITVDRSVSTGTLATSDPASFQYTTSDGTGTNGIDYTGNTTPITVNFPAGSPTATFNIPLLNNTSIFGDKNFTVTISNPSVNSSNSVAELGSPTSELVTVTDPRTEDTFSAASEFGTVPEIATVLSTGVRQDVTGGTVANDFFDISGPGNSNEAFGVANFNDTANDGTDVFDLPNPVGTINEITFSAINDPTTSSPPSLAGLFNVYLVDDTTTSTWNSTAGGHTLSPLTFESSVTPQGVGTNQLTQNGGGIYQLGSFTYSTTESTTQYTNFPLTMFNAHAYSVLANDLNNHLQFRIVVTPADTTPGSKEYASFRGGEATITGNAYPAPMISFNYTPTVVATNNGVVPAWLNPNSVASWNSSTQQLDAYNGPVGIISDPMTNGGDSPIITTDGGAAAAITIAGASGSVQPIHIGGLTLTGGASLTVNSVTGTQSPSNVGVLVVASGGPFSVSSTSKLDLTNNDLIVHGAGTGGLVTATSDLKSAFSGGLSGAWTGAGITSSTAASNPKSNTGLAPVLAGARTTFDGQTVASNDLLVKYTYFGDASLGGTVVASDYVAIDNAFNLRNSGSPPTGWQNGDFNYDGVINGDDYALIDNAFNTQGNPASPLAQVASSQSAATPAVPAKSASVFATGNPIPVSYLTGNVSSISAGIFGDDKKSLADELLG